MTSDEFYLDSQTVQNRNFPFGNCGIRCLKAGATERVSFLILRLSLSAGKICLVILLNYDWNVVEWSKKNGRERQLRDRDACLKPSIPSFLTFLSGRARAAALGPRGGRVMNGSVGRRRRGRGPKTTFSPLSVITSKPPTERAHTGDITLSLLDSNVLFMPLFYHLGVVLGGLCLLTCTFCRPCVRMPSFSMHLFSQAF